VGDINDLISHQKENTSSGRGVGIDVEEKKEIPSVEEGWQTTEEKKEGPNHREEENAEKHH